MEAVQFPKSIFDSSVSVFARRAGIGVGNIPESGDLSPTKLSVVLKTHPMHLKAGYSIVGQNERKAKTGVTWNFVQIRMDSWPE